MTGLMAPPIEIENIGGGLADEVHERSGASPMRCYQCAKCSSGCPVPRSVASESAPTTSAARIGRSAAGSTPAAAPRSSPVTSRILCGITRASAPGTDRLADGRRLRELAALRAYGVCSRSAEHAPRSVGDRDRDARADVVSEPRDVGCQ